MPCNSDGMGEYYREMEAKKIRDRLADMLCRACFCIESDRGAFPPGMEDVATWWEAHKKADEKAGRR